MAAIIFAWRRHCREQREPGRRMRFFFPHVLIYLECQIIQTYHLPSHVIFNLLQEIKDDLEPKTNRHAMPGLSKLLAPLNFFGLWFFSTASLFLYSLFATMLIFTALCILRWFICKWDVASVFFNLRIVSKSCAEISTPIVLLLFLETGP